MDGASLLLFTILSFVLPVISITCILMVIEYYKNRSVGNIDAEQDGVWSITGNMRQGQLFRDQVTVTNEADKPPSYDEEFGFIDPPTYEQALFMARSSNLPLPHLSTSDNVGAKAVN